MNKLTLGISAVIIVAAGLFFIVYFWSKLRFRERDFKDTYIKVLEDGYGDYIALGAEMINAIINTKDEDIDNFHHGKIRGLVKKYNIYRMKRTFEYDCALSVLVLDIMEYIEKEVRRKNGKGKTAINFYLGKAKILFERYESVLAYKDYFKRIHQILTVQEVIYSAKEEIRKYTYLLQKENK